MQYTITTKIGGGTSGDVDQQFSVEADSYHKAAAIAVERLLPLRKDGRIVRGPVVAERTTGDYGKAGWHQGYLVAGDGSLNSTGLAFHVM